MCKSNLKLIKIGWADAIENLNGWHTEQEAIEWSEKEDWIVHQVGWVLKETESYILFTSQFNNASKDKSTIFSGLFKIPKPWILYVNELIDCENDS